VVGISSLLANLQLSLLAHTSVAHSFRSNIIAAFAFRREIAYIAAIPISFEINLFKLVLPVMAT
jgi:hypothetical protein